MKFRFKIIFLAWVFATSFTRASADWQSEIGFTRLQQLAGAELPTAPTQGLAQVEASEGGSNFEPNTALFTAKTFVHKSGSSGVSSHATHVATNFYGSTSQLPGTCEVDLYSANTWLYSDFLKVGTFSAPVVQSRAVMNHSWVGTLDSYDTEASRRLDFAINRDGLVCVVGLNNESYNPLPQLLCQTYNTISVGRDDGNHSPGPTTLEVANRIKPDIVAPSSSPEYATSWTTPMVAGAAGLLYAKLNTSYAITGADLPRVVKALLLASATKNTVPGWDNSETSPLDSIYGAGELNIYNAYTTLRTGRATASNSTQHKLRGWAAESIGTNATNETTKIYYFNIPAGAPSTPFSAALTWHRVVTDNISGNSWGNLSSSLTNLSLRLYNANGFNLGSEITRSNSSVDNVELIYQPALAPGNYALVVANPASSTTTPYALAWHSLPAVTITTTVSSAREIDGQSGLVTLTRAGDTTLPLLVPLAVSGTAISGSHYQALPASITIPAGQASATVSVIPIADALAQGNRTVIVAIASDFALVRDVAQTANVTLQDKPFDAWRFLNFTNTENTNPSISGETADPDGDDLANLIEYALGFGPKTPNTSPLTPLDLSGYLAVSVPVNAGATDITWGAQVGGDFSSWSNNVTTSTLANIFTARDNIPKSSSDRRFIRLKITRP